MHTNAREGAPIENGAFNMHSISLLFRVSTFAFAVAAAATLLAAPRQAQAQIIAGGSALTEGNSSTFPVIGQSGSVTQIFFPTSALSTLAIGNNITGLAFRLDGARTTGTPALSFVDYRIFLGQALDNSLEPTFADNYSNANPRTLVRSGALNIAAGAFAAGPGAGPEPFGPTITFDSAYSYQGGGLIIEIIHTPNGTGQNFFVDATTSGGSQALTNTPATALGGTSISAPITRLAIGPATVPEVGTGALLALAALPVIGACIARRKGARA